VGTGADACGRVLVVDDLLEVSDGHRGAAQLVHLALIVRGALRVRLDPLLVRHELLLHEKPVLDPLQLELAEKALGRGRDVGQAGRAVDSLLLQLLAHALRRRGRLPLLLLLLLLLAGTPARPARSPEAGLVSSHRSCRYLDPCTRNAAERPPAFEWEESERERGRERGASRRARTFVSRALRAEGNCAQVRSRSRFKRSNLLFFSGFPVTRDSHTFITKVLT